MAHAVRNTAPGFIHLRKPISVASAMWAALTLAAVIADGTPLQNDPEGFRGIRWGSSLSEKNDLTLISTWQHIQEYEFRDGPPRLGEAKLESLKLSTVSGEFARVTIRYQGGKTHKQVLAYLQSRFGAIERMPGSMMRGLNQQFTWRGPETEINLTYQAMGERGFIFIESRTLAPRFNDTLPERSP